MSLEDCAPPYAPRSPSTSYASNSLSLGFPPGYFLIKSAATGKLLDVTRGESSDGADIILWSEKEKSLVEPMRDPEADNQVFFIDYTGVLCSKLNGHAIDIDDNRLVLRHRHPVTYPFPNAESHPLPRFSYDRSSGVIRVLFACDPSYPLPSASPSQLWRERDYILAAVPHRRPKSLTESAAELLSSAASMLKFNPFGGPSASSSVVGVSAGEFDLREDEVLEEERAAADDDDDSPAHRREVRMLTFPMGWLEKEQRGESARTRDRQRWIVVPLQVTRTVTRPQPTSPRASFS